MLTLYVSYVESQKKKQTDFLEMEARMVVARPWGQGGMGRCKSKGRKLTVIRRVGSKDLM